MKKYKLKDILLPLILLICVIGLITYILFGAINISDSYNKLQTYNDNIGIYNDNLQKLSSFSNTTLTTKLNDFDKEIPVGGDIVNLIDSTINVAHTYGLSAEQDLSKQNKNDQKDSKNSVDIQDIQSGDLENIPSSFLINGSVYPVNLALSVKGDKNNIYQFLDSLSNSKNMTRKLTVQSITMNSTVLDQNLTEWTAKLAIYAYAVKDSKADLRKPKVITDPLDPTLLTPPKKVNTNI